MNLHLQRWASTDEGTPGSLVGMDFEFRTIELPFRDTNNDGIGDQQKSCITPGTYQCIWHLSPSKGPCYILQNVQGRSNILIHSANFAGDTDKGWESQLLGCIALGKSTGVMPNVKGRAQKAALQSRLAIKEFHQHMREQPFTLTIEASA